MHAKSFNISVQGASHIKKNKECQDASRSYYNNDIAIAVVCDGHGGSDYVRSAVGSSIAAEIAERNIKDFVLSVDEDELKRHSEQYISKLEASIIGNWNELIYQHYEQNPFTKEEIATLSAKAQKKYLQEKRIESAYGTTLIAVVVTPSYWFGIHIGDGKCVAVNPDGRFLQPIPWDEKCFLNATTSICDSRALENFRHFYSEKLPVAVFVGSDGIDDCFKNDQQLNNLYKTILYAFTTNEFDSALSDLRDYLPRLSAKGSGDDVSVAAVLDMDLIGEIEAVKEFDREKEKSRIEENAKLEAEKAEAERKRVEEEYARQKEVAARRKAASGNDDNQRSKVMPASNRHCHNCGAALLPGVKFCSECGARVTEDTEIEGRRDNTDTINIVEVVPYKKEATTDIDNTNAFASSEVQQNAEYSPGTDLTESNDDCSAEVSTHLKNNENQDARNDEPALVVSTTSEVDETADNVDQSIVETNEQEEKSDVGYDAQECDTRAEQVDLQSSGSDKHDTIAQDSV